jgi:cardiolipin synthase (CMP-forming)
VIVPKQSFFFSIPLAQRRITTASLITISRLLLAPIVAYFIMSMQWQKAAIFFFMAALTDVLDGAVARYFNQQTFLGEWLDALADKVLILSTFYALFIVDLVPSWFACIVCIREILLMLGAWWSYQQYGYFSLKPVPLAKTSMALYVGTVLVVLAACWQQVHIPYLYMPLIILTLACALVSLVQRYYQQITIRFSRSKV